MASGDPMGGIEAAGGWFSPTSNYGTADTRNTLPVIDFDASTEEAVYFTGWLKGYAGGGLTVKVLWSATSATSGDVVWGGSIERSNTDIDADSFATEQASAAVTAPGTGGIPAESTITFTSGANMDSLADGEHYRFKLARKTGAAGDTMTGDAEVWAVLVYET